MKLHNLDLEMSILYSICEGDLKVKSALLGSVMPEHFYNDVTNEAIKRVFSIVKTTDEPPSFSDLTTDPVLSEDTRKKLKRYSTEPLTKKKYQRKLKQLNEYHQVRELYFMSERVNQDLQSDSVKVSELLEKIANDLTNIRTNTNRKQEIHHIGRSNNSKSIVDRLLDKTPPKLIPTGFSGWDNVNGGIPYGALVGIGGPAGGGKCLKYDAIIPFNKSVEVEKIILTLEDNTLLELWANQPVLLKNGETKIAKYLTLDDEIDHR